MKVQAVQSRGARVRSHAADRDGRHQGRVRAGQRIAATTHAVDDPGTYRAVQFAVSRPVEAQDPSTPHAMSRLQCRLDVHRGIVMVLTSPRYCKGSACG